MYDRAVHLPRDFILGFDVEETIATPADFDRPNALSTVYICVLAAIKLDAYLTRESSDDGP